MRTDPKRAIGTAAAALLVCAVGLNAGAASRYTETFDSGAAGWSHAGSLAVTGEESGLRGQFAAQGFPFPESGSFVATNTASNGAFNGDYSAAGIQLIGFSFLAQDVLPSAALVRWSGPESSFFRSFADAIAQTGVWYRIAFSLQSQAAGRWVGGMEPAFEESLRDVRSLEIQITRAGMTAQRYRLEDVFVDALPAGTEVFGDGAVVWSRLRADQAYVVEAVGDPTQAWEAVEGFAASNSTRIWLDPAPTHAPRRFYRLRFPEYQP